MAIIAVVVYALLELIASLLLNGSCWIASQIINTSLYLFAEDENVFTRYSKLLPIDALAENGLNLADIIFSVAGFVFFTIAIVSLIRIVASTFGEKAQNPYITLGRIFLTLVVVMLFFGGRDGTLDFLGDGIVGWFGVRFGAILRTICGSELPFKDIGVKVWPTGGIGSNHIAVAVLTFALFKNTFSAAVGMFERVFQLLLLTLASPITVTCFASRETENITYSWMKSLFAQFASIALSLVLWSIYIRQLIAIGDGDQFSELITSGTSILNYVSALVVIMTINNADSILTAIGLKALTTKATAQAIREGASSMKSTFVTTVAAAKMFSKGAGKQVAAGGKNASYGGGELQAKQNWFKDKIADIKNSIQGKSAGQPSASMGPKMANETLDKVNGSASGTVINPTSGSNVGESLNVAVNGSDKYQGNSINFATDSSSIVGTTMNEALDTTEIKGVATEATIDSSRGNSTGMYFTPTKYSGNEVVNIPQGTEVNFGETKAYIGESYTINAAGNKTYRLNDEKGNHLKYDDLIPVKKPVKSEDDKK